MKLQTILDRAHTAKQKIDAVATDLLVGVCTLVAYRCGNELPWVDDGKGTLRPCNPSEAAQHAINHGIALALKLRKVTR